MSVWSTFEYSELSYEASFSFIFGMIWVSFTCLSIIGFSISQLCFEEEDALCTFDISEIPTNLPCFRNQVGFVVSYLFLSASISILGFYTARGQLDIFRK